MSSRASRRARRLDPFVIDDDVLFVRQPGTSDTHGLRGHAFGVVNGVCGAALATEFGTVLPTMGAVSAAVFALPIVAFYVHGGLDIASPTRRDGVAIHRLKSWRNRGIVRKVTDAPRFMDLVRALRTATAVEGVTELRAHAQQLAWAHTCLTADAAVLDAQIAKAAGTQIASAELADLRERLAVLAGRREAILDTVNRMLTAVRAIQVAHDVRMLAVATDTVPASAIDAAVSTRAAQDAIDTSLQHHRITEELLTHPQVAGPAAGDLATSRPALDNAH